VWEGQLESRQADVKSQLASKVNPVTAHARSELAFVLHVHLPLEDTGAPNIKPGDLYTLAFVQ